MLFDEGYVKKSMNSINQNQPEENHKDLAGFEAIDKMKALVNHNNVCFFCTKINTGESFSSRPMTVQHVDDYGNLWFLSANDSRQNEEIASDNAVQLLFQGSGTYDYLSVYGHATITRDKAIIAQLWKPILKVWFTEGVDDPRISVIKIKPAEGYYWDTKHNKLISMFKIVAGAVMGKTFDDSIEGKIEV